MKRNIVHLMMAMFILLPGTSWAQSLPSDCQKPSNWSSQRDGNSTSDASGCIRDAMRLNYPTYTSGMRGTLQNTVSYHDHTDVYYYVYGYKSLEWNKTYCITIDQSTGSPAPLLYSQYKAYVWKSSSAGSSFGTKLVGEITSTKGVEFKIGTSAARYYFSFHLTASRISGRYDFKIKEGSCGSTSTSSLLDYNLRSFSPYPYKKDTYTGGNGIANYDGKGVALVKSTDRPSYIGTGPNETSRDGDKFSFVVRSSVVPKSNYHLKLYIRGGSGTTSWKQKTMIKDVTYKNSKDAFVHRYYYVMKCTKSPGTNDLGPGTNYQYYFSLEYDGKKHYLPPQAANGKYLDAPDCKLNTTQEPKPEPKTEPTPEPKPEPTTEPTTDAGPSEPQAEPTSEPTAEPTLDAGPSEPQSEPTTEPTAEPTLDAGPSEPSQEPAPEPKTEPTTDAGTPETKPGTPDVKPPTEAPPTDKGDCYTNGCPKGQICLKGKCEPDKCENVKCKGNEFCRDGQCFPSCANVLCRKDELCYDGKCEPNPCYGVKCKEGQYCCLSSKECGQAGKCMENKCKSVTCPQGQFCFPVDGQCRDDLCANVRCIKDKHRCELGQCYGPNTDEPNTNSDGGTNSGNGKHKTSGEAGLGCNYKAQEGLPLNDIIIGLIMICLVAFRRKRKLSNESFPS